MKVHTERMDRTAPPKHVARLSLNNKTPLSRNAGKMSFACPTCYLVFERYVCWASRVSVNYCSRECSSEGRKVRVLVPCVTCGEDMELTPSAIGKVTTCGKVCSSKRRQSDTPQPRGFVAYKDAAAVVAKLGVCSQCGTQAAPWRVRGIKSTLIDGVIDVDASKAKLWCLHCHSEDNAPKGGRARQRQVRERKDDRT